jgi:putative CRISPR-associated protein (TIGR02619 family)
MKENKFRSTIFVPVGTSLLGKAKDSRCRIYSEWRDNLIEDISGFREEIKKVSAINDQDLELIREISWKKWRDCFLNVPNKDGIKLFNAYTEKVQPDSEIAKREMGKLEYEPDKLTAELASLYLFYKKERKQENDTEAMSTNLKEEIILLASDTDRGLYCACFLAEYLMQQEPYKNQIGKVHVERVIGLVGDDSDTFEKQGLDNLLNQTTKLIQERQGERQLYLNVTGGYKGVLPYLVLLGLAFGKVDIFYLFELSDKIVWLPKMPVGFDLLSWRNYRAFIRSIPYIEGLEEKDLEALIPNTMRTLLEREKVNKKFSPTTLGKVLHDQYEGERGKEISEYGRGYLLTDKINNPQKQQALRDCIDRWQYLWIGDLIPETVEHARGHAQRDLELLAQIIYPILNKEPNFFGKDQTDDNLLVLLSSIWLHDLGHSGDHLKCENRDGTIKDGKTITRNIKGFPSLVRDLHHLLSWYLIGKGKEEANTLFNGKLNIYESTSIFDNNIIDAIRQVCLYHRGKMPVLENQYLFCLNPDYKQYLNDGEVNSELKKGFEENKQSLSTDAVVSKIEEKHWRIVDGKRGYKIEDTETQLNMYGNKPFKHVGIEITKPLEKLHSNKVNLPLLGALLRIADAGEVQQERTISEEYEAMRILQNNREIESLEKEEASYRKIVRSTFDGDSKPSLPYYLKFTMEIAEKYFSNANADAFELNNFFRELTEISDMKLNRLQKTDVDERYKDEYLDLVVDGCVRKFVQKDTLDSIDNGGRLFLKNWLSALNQYIFKKRQPAHFDKHRGIRAIMYLLERTDKTKDNKNEYHFKVLAIYRKAEKYLFSWDNLQGDDKGKLRRYLRDDFAIDWTENAKINKSPSGMTINISEDNENRAEIIWVDNKEKAILKISDGRTYDLKVKNECGKLKIYSNPFRLNAKQVLVEEIKDEYEKVKKILNDHRIYFDSYWKMEEGKDEDLVWSVMPSDFCLGYYVTVIRPDRAWNIEVNARGVFLVGIDREPMTPHLNLTDEQLQNLWQCCVSTWIFQVEPVTTHSPEQNFIQLVVLKADGKEYRWFLDEKQIPEPILHLLRLLAQYAYEANIPQVTSYMSHLILSKEQKQ